MKRYIKYIIFNAIAIAATCAIIYFGRQHEPAWALFPELTWIVIVAAGNLFMISREPRDLRYDLSRACRKSPFKEQLHSMANAYDEVLDRQDFFASEDYQGPVAEAYSLIKRQVESNVTSAIDIAMQHPKGKPAKSDYIDELADYTKQLVGKLEQLVEQAIRLRSMRDDVDTSFVADYIQSMDAVLESDDLTYDAYAAKYAAEGTQAAPVSAPADGQAAGTAPAPADGQAAGTAPPPTSASAEEVGADD